MRRMVGGREIEINERSDGTADVRDIRRAAGVGKKQILIEQFPDGSSKIVPAYGDHRLDSQSAFLAAPLISRGCRASDAARRSSMFAWL
jgi:hypothetical protein